MSGYHSFELCYLAAMYTNLLITKQPLDMHFKPKPGGFKDNILRVAPDMLPQGSIKIESVELDGKAVHGVRRRCADRQNPPDDGAGEDQGPDCTDRRTPALYRPDDPREKHRNADAGR